MIKKPKVWPPKVAGWGRGSGSWLWDAEMRPNQPFGLQFWLGDKKTRVWGESTTACIVKRDAARAKVAEAKVEVERLDHGDATVREMYDAWLVFQLGKHASQTEDGYRASQAIIYRDRIANKLARVVTVGNVEDMMQAARRKDGKPYSRSQLKGTRGHLAMAFDFGIRRGYATVNPARDTEMPGNATKAAKPEWLNAEQFTVLRNYLNADLTPQNVAVLTVLLTGMRAGETLALSWDVVDWERRDIVVRRNVQQSNGGRVRTVVNHLKGKEEGESRLLHDLPADLMTALREQHNDHPFTYAFPDRTGKEPMRFEGLRWHCAKACRAAGVPVMGPHDLRHTLGSMMLDAGATPANVAAHLGHTLEVFMSIYGHPMTQVSTARLLGDGTNG